MDPIDPPADEVACCDSQRACVFAKALLSQQAHCGMVRRLALAERELLECSCPAARADCASLAALLRERARFALRLPPQCRPLMHQQALRLQCGGLHALQQVLDGEGRDVRGLLELAQSRHGSLGELSWAPLVEALARWQPPRRGRPRA